MIIIQMSDQPDLIILLAVTLVIVGAGFISMLMALMIIRTPPGGFKELKCNLVCRAMFTPHDVVSSPFNMHTRNARRN